MPRLPPGSWEGSEVGSEDIRWLRRSRRVPPAVTIRRAGNERSPAPEPGERVVFLAHFERGFGLPASDFFRQFLDFFGLQPHHLSANSIVSLSAFATLSEAYFGLWPTTELWSQYFRLRKHTIPAGSGRPVAAADRPMVACGAVSISPKQNSPLPRVQGLDTVKKWQKTFFYVKNAEGRDDLNLPEFSIEPPVAEKNFKYTPAESTELELVARAVEALNKRGLCADDLLGTFILRRVCPLQRRVHKMCHMKGRLDPNRTSRHGLTQADVMKRVKAIANSQITEDWEWKVEPYRRNDPAPVVSHQIS